MSLFRLRMNQFCSEAALSEKNNAARSVGLKTKLTESWTQDCMLVRHADLPKIEFSKEALQHMFTPSKCLAQGVCDCRSNSDAAGAKNVLACRDKIVAYLKKHCWSKTIDEKKQKSPARTLLEEAGQVWLLGRNPQSPEQVYPVILQCWLTG